MSVVISDAVNISAPHLKHSLFIPVRCVGNVKFFNLKKDQRIERLLVTGRERNVRKLTNTTIIETVMAVRDAAVRLQLFRNKIEEPIKRLRYTRAITAKVVEHEDDVLDVLLPAVGDVEETPARVLHAIAGTCLYIEMSDIVVSYLQRVVSCQIECDDGDRAMRDKTVRVSLAKGVSRQYKQNRVRGVRRGADGKERSKTFCVRKLGLAQAVEKAEQFVSDRSLARSGGDGNGGDGTDDEDDCGSIASDHSERA